MDGGATRPASMGDFLEALKKRKSSLPPWFKLAFDQIQESGEVDLFSGMLDDIMKYAGGVEAAVKPNLNFSDVADLSTAKEKIKKLIVYPLSNPQLAKKYGRAAGGGVLFYGPPGCGKTYLTRATAGECDATFFNVKITDILSEEAGESERKLHAVFERAARNTPAILFFDEIDALAARRESAGKGRTLINQFLTELDGFNKREGLMIVGSTNAPWDVDPALRRAGRFTYQVYLPAPDAQARVEMFKLHTKDKPVDKKIDFKKFAGLTEGFSSADIKAVVDSALERPWSEALSGKPERKANSSDFEAAIRERSSTLSAWYILARDQLAKSGEREVYPELWVVVSREGSKAACGRTELEYEIRETREQIQILKKKRDKGELDDETFKELLKDLQKTLIKLEAKQND